MNRLAPLTPYTADMHVLLGNMQVDSGAAANIETQYAQTEERSNKSMLEMYVAAVEADDDDDDFISAEAFLDE